MGSPRCHRHRIVDFDSASDVECVWNELVQHYEFRLLDPEARARVLRRLDRLEWLGGIEPGRAFEIRAAMEWLRPAIVEFHFWKDLIPDTGALSLGAFLRGEVAP